MHDMILVNHISKAYGGHKVLNDLSAEIPLCGVTVIRGQSGAGKTTLFRLLLGLEKTRHGRDIGDIGSKTRCCFSGRSSAAMEQCARKRGAGNRRNTGGRSIADTRPGRKHAIASTRAFRRNEAACGNRAGAGLWRRYSVSRRAVHRIGRGEQSHRSQRDAGGKGTNPRDHA